MTSLHDVARLAGVSKTLVSRVVNGQTGVSEASRKKIQDAMKELNYRPNALARSLVTHRTQTVGVVMDSLVEPYFFPMIEGLEEAVEATGYDLVFTSGRNNVAHKYNAVSYFEQGRADGIILYGSRLEDDAIIHSLASRNLPFVVVENTFPSLSINNISLDNDFGSDLAIRHLASCGCRRVCHVSGGRETHVAMDRQNGYLSAMQRCGLPVSEEMIIHADFTIENSCRIMRDWLRSPAAESRPDAFYCASDKTAYGVITALEEAGLHVPEDVMVIGFDDEVPPLFYRHAPLTTLSQPLKKMGKAAMSLLLENIKSPDAQHQHIRFYPSLVVRQSTCPTKTTE